MASDAPLDPPADPPPQGSGPAGTGPEAPRAHHAARGPLALSALGIVFGDIGTSPLYSLQAVFSVDHNSVAPTRGDVFGIISMVFWVITVIVSVKYIALVMRADNDGEGGLLALVALIRRRLGERGRLTGTALILGMVGAALFYGDSLITPAISVMSAFEGLAVVRHGLSGWVLPLSVGLLAVVFWVQRFGTTAVGHLYGPIMVVWFLTLAVLGVPHILATPEILGALLPHHAIVFAVERPGVAFIAMGAVVLVITGAEALYADMGHVGPRPIRLAWFGLVFPALTLNYLGQGTVILGDPTAIDNPFFHLAPTWATVPLVGLAALATVIASQAVISGAFSVSRQAARLGILPRLTIRHTSRREGGQIYIGSVNWMLFAGVLVPIALFRSSVALAAAYGLAVTGTLVLTSVLFMVFARRVLGAAWWQLVVFLVLIVGVELVLLAANLTKLLHGGWLPVTIAVVLVTVMATWRWGAARAAAGRARLESPLDAFLSGTDAQADRVPGVAVFLHQDPATTPLALRDTVTFNRVLHAQNVIMTVVNADVPHIRHAERVVVERLPHPGFIHVICRDGFMDPQDVPRALARAQALVPDLDLDVHRARYFLSIVPLTTAHPPSWRRWRTAVFLWLAGTAADRTTAFHLPPDRTVIMGGRLVL
ncbi:KUP system potassium uptake protein [Brevibacterium pityocampae]